MALLPPREGSAPSRTAPCGPQTELRREAKAAIASVHRANDVCILNNNNNPKT